jgi:hypothetical protein
VVNTHGKPQNAFISERDAEYLVRWVAHPVPRNL